MSYCRYFRERFLRAYSDTRTFGEKHLGGSIAALVVSAIGAGYAAHNGGETVSSQLPSLIGAGIVGPLTVISVAFVICWLLSPYKIYRDQAAKITALSPPEQHPLDYTICLTAMDAPMPDVVLPEGMRIFRIHPGMHGIGMSFSSAAPGSSFSWPAEQLPRLVVRCSFENFGEAALLGVRAQIEILIQECIRTGTGSSQSGKVIDTQVIQSDAVSLASGAKTSFFISNEGPNYGHIRLPETCQIKRIGRADWEIVKLAPPSGFAFTAIYPFERPSPVTTS